MPPGLPSDLLRRRPDLREAEQNLIAANAEVGVANADFFPRISLTGAFGGVAPQISQLFPAGRTWTIGGGLLTPVFQGRRLREQYRAAVARWEQARVQYEQSVTNAFSEVSTALVAYQKYAEVERERAREVAAYREAVRLVEPALRGRPLGLPRGAAGPAAALPGRDPARPGALQPPGDPGPALPGPGRRLAARRSAVDGAQPTGSTAMKDDPVIRLFLQTAQAIEERLETALEGVELSVAKYSALKQLALADEPLSFSELAARLVCVRSNVSQLVDRLEADGLVRRVEDPKDRRCMRADLTGLGRERQAAGAERMETVRGGIVEILSEVDRGVLERALEKLRGSGPAGGGDPRSAKG